MFAQARSLVLGRYRSTGASPGSCGRRVKAWYRVTIPVTLETNMVYLVSTATEYFEGYRADPPPLSLPLEQPKGNDRAQSNYWR
jgi:hypothetical protein